MGRFLGVIALILFLGGSAWATKVALERHEARLAAEGADAKDGGKQGGGPGRGAPSGPLVVEVLVAKGEILAEKVTAYGSLVANESVEVASEIDGRLAAIHVQEGSTVNAGDLLFTIDVETMEAELRELEVRLDFARRKSVRLKSLYDSAAVSESEWEDAQRESSSLEAQIDSIRTRLSKKEVRAPFEGRVGLRRASLGAWLQKGDELLTLQDVSPIKVDFKVPERFAGNVRQGANLRLRVEGMAGWAQGTVAAIEPTIEAATRSLIVRGVADNPGGELVPGAFATVELEVATPRPVILVPSECIIPTPVGPSVFVAEKGRAVRRTVTLGLRTADRVQIVDGVNEGESVITSNLLRVKPGGEVAMKDEG